MNGVGIPRPGAPSAAEGFRRSRKPPVDVCNQREDRAHPGAARFPRTRRVSTDADHRRPAGGRAPVTRLGVELPLYRSPRLDQASARSTRGLLGSEVGTLVGQRGSRLPGEASAHLVPRGSPSTRRANGKAVERTRVPLRRSEPRFFTVALRAPQRSPNEGVHFSRAQAV
jgi:hypothetical protein